MNRVTIKESTYKALSPTPQWINTASSSACFKFLITTGSAETEVDISEPGSRLILCQILVSVYYFLLLLWLKKPTDVVTFWYLVLSKNWCDQWLFVNKESAQLYSLLQVGLTCNTIGTPAFPISVGGTRKQGKYSFTFIFIHSFFVSFQSLYVNFFYHNA